MTKVSAVACTTLAILFFSSANSSAAAGASLVGVIKDASGARVPNALVLLSAADNTGNTLAATSTDSGEWELRSVPSGQYTLEIRKPGFRAHRQPITLPDRPVQLEHQLVLGGLQENVTVQAQAPAPPPSTNGVPTRIRIGGNVQSAKVLHRVVPEYPPHLKSAGITGTVVLRAVISREGDVLHLESISPEVHPDLVAVSIEAVKEWKYQSTLLNGVPVEVETLVNINFTLTP